MESLISQISRIFMLVASAALLLLVLLATGNVAMRLVRVPFAGTYEFVSFLGALVIAGALGHTQRRKDHIVVDILSERFPGPVKRVLDAVNYGVTCALFAIASWQLYRWGEKIRISGELSETLKLPFHPFIYGVAAGFTFLTLVLLLDFMRTIFHPREDQQELGSTN